MTNIIIEVVKSHSPTGWLNKMFEIGFNNGGDVVFSGRLGAAQAGKAQAILDQVSGQCVVDMGGLTTSPVQAWVFYSKHTSD